MEIRPGEPDRSRSRGMVRRPRRRRRPDRAEVRFTLDEGRPEEEGIRQHRMDVGRVELWGGFLTADASAFSPKPTPAARIASRRTTTVDGSAVFETREGPPKRAF